MASRKSALPAKAGTKKSSGNTLPALPADFLAELQKDAVEGAANVRTFCDSNIVSTKGGVFSFKGENFGDQIDTVLLAYAHLNEYYPGTYDPNKKGQTPTCYALSTTGQNMSPHAAAPDKHASTCTECEYAAFGSALVGKGRACKQKMRIAFLHSDDTTSADSVAEALIAQVGVPAMSVSNLGAYLKILAGNPAAIVPMYAMRTRLRLEKHATYQFVMKFEPIEIINDYKTLVAIRQRVKNEATDLVLAPFPASATDNGRGGKGGGSAASGKKKQVIPTKAASGTRSRFGK